MTVQSEMALPLEYKEQPNPPRRPHSQDRRIRERAADLLMPEIIRWLGDDWREEQSDEYRKDLIDALNCSDADGYALAVHLERHSHWSPNAELVEILDSFPVWNAEQEAVKEWVAANQVKPKLGVGSFVKYGNVTGVIVAIHSETAEYVVQTDAWLANHPDQQGKCGGYVLAFEKVPPLSEEAHKANDRPERARPAQRDRHPSAVPAARRDHGALR
jgi:hypothetical protein